MAKYTKETVKQGDKEVVRYKDGTDYVATNKVPTNVVNALADVKEGIAVDELGDYINPETDTDESEDETAPDNNTPADDDSVAADDVDAGEEAPIPQDEEGMGFKRVKGKTVDIFDGKTPHQEVRSVAGVMVPLSRVNALGDPKNDIEPKTDAEIIEKLKKLGKL
jgi:hypothetical protein